MSCYCKCPVALPPVPWVGLQFVFFFLIKLAFLLTLYCTITPLKYHVFENIIETGAFAFFGANAPFSIIFSNVFKT